MKLLIVGTDVIWQRGFGAGVAQFLRAGCTLCASGVGGLCIVSGAARCERVWPGSGAMRCSTGLARGLARSVMAGQNLQ